MNRKETRKVSEDYQRMIIEENEINEAKRKLKDEQENAFNEALKNKELEKYKKYKNKLFNQKIRPDKKDFVEVNSGVKMVETSGYKSAKQQIMEFTLAGKKLEELRSDETNFNLEDDRVKPITVYTNMIDLHEDMMNIYHKSIKYSKELQKAQKKLDEVENERGNRRKEKDDDKIKVKEDINDDINSSKEENKKN